MCNSQNLCKTAIVILIWNGFSALATVYDSDVSSINIQSIHDTLARNGDTITLPIGTFTWSTPVSFTKAVNIPGAGTDQTVIYDNVPKTGGGGVMWSFNVAAGKSIRVTGFTVHGQGQDTQNYNKGTITIGGASHSVRVDHIDIILPGTGAMIFDGDI